MVGGGAMPFGGLLSLVLLVGIVFLVVRGLSGRNSRARSPALDTLEERYAKGEMPRDEYLQKKKDIGA